MCPGTTAVLLRMYCVQVMVLLLWTTVVPMHVDSAAVSRRNVTGGSLRPEIISNNTTHPSTDTGCAVYQDTIKNTKPPFTDSRSLLRIHDATYGRLSLNWYSSAHFVWRVICAGEATAVLLMRLNISSGDYLQVKHRQLQGCTADYKGFVFRKRSILIGYVPDVRTDGGEFELGYVCFDSAVERLASNIFYNERIMEYFQQHNGTFEKVAHLLRHPQEIIRVTDSDLRHILNLAQPPPPEMERENSTDSTTGSSENESDS